MVMKEFKTEKHYMHFLNFSKTSQNVFPECLNTAANWERNQSLLEADLFEREATCPAWQDHKKSFKLLYFSQITHPASPSQSSQKSGLQVRDTSKHFTGSTYEHPRKVFPWHVRKLNWFLSAETLCAFLEVWTKTLKPGITTLEFKTREKQSK